MDKKKRVGNNKGKKLTYKQQRFIEELENTGNATEAAERVYKTKTRKSAGAIGAENLSKPIIVESIEERVRLAKNKIFYLSQYGEKEDIQLKASQDVVDRVEGKAVQPTKEDKTIDMKIKVEDMSTEELNELLKKTLGK